MSAPGGLIAVGETTFARWVRVAAVPVVVMFRAARCDACRALGTNVARLADRYAGQLVVLSVDVERAPLLAEQYGVSAVPTLLVLHHGDELTRMVGFAPEPLLRLLFDQVVGGDLTPGLLWSPTEQAYEDAVIVPLIDGWGWTYRRQVACPGRAGNLAAPGRVDVLVYDADAAAPLTLFEDKRQIASNAALQQAMLQARGYAQALRLASFVVAAPAGMWVYQLRDERARLMQSFSSLDVATHPEVVKHALRWLQEVS
jgi:thiol-disulfide isomerase/thioredoxin